MANSFLSSQQNCVDGLNFTFPSRYVRPRLIAKGKRGLIYKAYDTTTSQDVAIKVSKPSSRATNTVGLEATFLQKANVLGIGPRYIEHTDTFVVMEFITGTPIGIWLKNKPSLSSQKKVSLHVLIQLTILDEAGINKFELTNPYKHILVHDNLDVTLIDFERARHTTRPKNVAQFRQYLKKHNLHGLLGELFKQTTSEDKS